MDLLLQKVVFILYKELNDLITLFKVLLVGKKIH